MVYYTAEMLSSETWWEESRETDGPLHADGVSYQAYYSEVGKAHHMGKDLTGVRSPQRKLVPDNVGLGQYEPTSLQAIATKAEVCKKHRFQDLYRCLNARYLLSCWKEKRGDRNFMLTSALIWSKKNNDAIRLKKLNNHR